ncbi:hypothetical protein G7054_g1178 [Neopestalotiopsis clavispora]|nr:hypothetical protein G7054_g1178 [Neopestalotiopsis clavispora]
MRVITNNNNRSSSHDETGAASASTTAGLYRFNKDFANSSQRLSRLAPAPSPLSSGRKEPTTLPQPMQTLRGIQPATAGAAAGAAAGAVAASSAGESVHDGKDASAYTGAEMLRLCGSQDALVRTPSSLDDFNLTCFILSEDGQEARADPDKPPELNWQESSTESSSLGDISNFDSHYTEPSPQVLEYIDSAQLTDPSSWQSPHSSRESDITTPLSLQENGSLNGCPNDHAKRHESGDSVVNAPLGSSLCGVLELSRQLAEDHEILQKGDVYPPYAKNTPNPLKTAVQRALNRSSHFCELLKNIEAENLFHGGRNGPESLDSPASSCCAILTTSLVTSFILLARIWRRIFIYLHRLLLGTPTLSASEMDCFTIIPCLQLGGFRVQSSLATQVAVLIDLSFDMVGQIETSLGAGRWGLLGGSGQGATAEGRQQQPVIDGPVTSSIRDMLLSQEKMTSCAGDKLDALPLRELATQLKSQLSKQLQ